MKCRLRDLDSKNKLAEILSLKRVDLLKLSKNADSNYNEFTSYRNKKPRQVEEPRPDLKVVLKRLNRILQDEGLPDHLYSGRKGRSYVENAKAHLGNRNMIKMDIKQFYPSCTRELVYQFFLKDLGTSQDVAHVLTNLCTYKRHVPTGSPVSQTLAFLINRAVFDRIANYAKKRGLTFTLYVDDLCFSSNNKIDPKISVFVNSELKKHGLTLSRKKIVSYNGDKPKHLTGCVIVGTTLEAPNKLMAKLFDPLELSRKTRLPLTEDRARSAFGLINAIRQIEGANKLEGLNVSLKNQIWTQN